MFTEIETLIGDLRERIGTLKRSAIYGGDYFHALALAVCYNKMIQFADERSQTHPEVQRVPELRTILLFHFMENADRHIRLQGDRIFNDAILGGPRTIREWQEAGYHTRRTPGNYQRRLQYWKAIYDDAPILDTKRQVSEDIFGPVTHVSIPSKTRISPHKHEDLGGAKVQYEDVIYNRNLRYSATDTLVPWWQLLNYGTSFGGAQGYPSVPGLHFVEDAEQEVPATLDFYANLFTEYLIDTFDSEVLEQDDIIAVESWVNRHVHLDNEYVSSLDLARILTFGVPF